jgi:cupin fold WbuC family metalloprotein
MIKINDELINPLLKEGQCSDRKRKNFNFHPEASDPMHRMIHTANKETYVQPHKHENPDKTEAFIILRGKVLVVEFNNDGEITDHIIMDSTTGNHGVEIPPRVWHTLITLEDNSVIYEVKNGPWNPADDKFFAPWAPKEGEEGTENYKKSILQELQLL